MRNLILSLIVAFLAYFCFFGNLYAVDKTGTLEFGFKGGINLASATGDDATLEDEEFGKLDPKTRLGIIAGGFLTYYINDMFAIQPEILYNQKGTKYEYSTSLMGNSVSMDIRVKYDYIDIPVLAKLIIPVQQVGSFNLHLGPSAGFKILSEGQIKTSISGIVNQTKDTTIKNEDAKSFVLNLIIGGGFGLNLDFGTISIEARYNLPLMNSDNKSEGATKEPDIKLNAISIMACLAFK